MTAPQQLDQQTVATALDNIWFTRCPVPTATGLAYKLGWLGDEFANDKIAIDTLQENRDLGRHHYDHDLPSLIREGGNILALAARAQGARTRLIGLTWIEEWQAILVRPDSAIREPKDLKGKRLALPDWNEHALASHQRGTSIARGMSLQGYRGVLHYAGLTFDDVELVEVPSNRKNPTRTENLESHLQDGLRLWRGIDYLVQGKVDAVYVKGASAVDAARAAGVVVGIDLDRLPDPGYRVNNGTPRPITVHEDFINNHFDSLVRFLAQTLRAADWAVDHEADVHRILQGETRGSSSAVVEAYRDDFHKKLHPDLSPQRLAWFEQQKKSLWLHGFLENDFDFADWVDPRPLEAAHELLQLWRQGGKA
ncbi:ABC transporter substrate-binding protein [Cellvibrio japonicus]|uniref:Putative dibenzothiophene desulfurization enzyme B n=1 Tax=Cellvibrio japonicus (strain Ueda107) TaxID=498211 RepID=B3PJX5_CELJU|nr:ABC transporter substrate-binding protein [Cellvibrio japonicus]ACE82941.1 putative dibenzothiophene desulfurization enzyme B [Cellvibrio japonicus Ueda107]QEI12750.1 ABC transporter substrate-binding protein [Cellvibrio japonicus]QEI16324.1 ABC transporter substrate-binding protein [Cellvibrio japonicus]QEI19902.1 ABC transporter substrate-binding protein [Cellvibrio japonicus]